MTKTHDTTEETLCRTVGCPDPITGEAIDGDYCADCALTQRREDASTR